MIVFTKDIQYNQCKREDILNDQNSKIYRLSET